MLAISTARLGAKVSGLGLAPELLALVLDESGTVIEANALMPNVAIGQPAGLN